jgi:hypothetical protein
MVPATVQGESRDRSRAKLGGTLDGFVIPNSIKHEQVPRAARRYPGGHKGAHHAMNASMLWANLEKDLSISRIAAREPVLERVSAWGLRR